MKFPIAIFLMGATLVQGLLHISKCNPQSYVKVGCFKDNIVPKRALTTQLLNRMDPHSKKGDGQLIDLNNYGQSLKELVCRCSQLAKAKGFEYFAIQFYGECWAGHPKDATRHGISKGGCVDARLKDGSCGPRSTECAGKCGENFVYRVAKPVDGGWSSWGKYGACVGRCGSKGVQRRYRTCSKPRPVDGGKPCVGPRFSTKTCQKAACPGKWQNWSSWTQCVQTRQRRCTVNGKPAPQSQCGGNPTERRTCQKCQGNWGGWGVWSDCGTPNKPCGTGSRVRRRVCLPFPGFHCPGKSEERISCQHQCKKTCVWGRCSKSCGGGIRIRARKCVAVGTNIVVSGCPGVSSQQGACNTQVCPIWIWGPWSRCSRTCGSGSQNRAQICVVPGTSPPKGTTGCSGKGKVESKSCLIRGCPVWTQWGSWSPCPKCRPSGTPAPKRIRQRRCVYEGSNINAAGCQGARIEFQNCITLNCGPLPCSVKCLPTDIEGKVCVRNNAGREWTMANECAFKRLRCSMPGLTMRHGKCLTLPGGGLGPIGPGGPIPVGPAQ
ncbi:coadhesin-like [Clytia hemisphaerica]|uniref:Uncharacterized protein n=1 Tax=Clytia hemisphaerica TaxID=252671 RepID=A0A7M5XC14_9CNID